MREIKFRIWDEQRNKFHYWGFIDNCFVGIGTAFGINYTEKNSEQYTGLKDYYAGDLVKISGADLKTSEVKKITHEDYMFMLGNYSLFFANENYKLEKIGNIHEDNKTNDN